MVCSADFSPPIPEFYSVAKYLHFFEPHQRQRTQRKRRREFKFREKLLVLMGEKL
jgi:hypothetical protein